MAGIAQLCLSRNRGGMEIYVERISAALARRGHPVRVVTAAGTYLARRVPAQINHSVTVGGIRDLPRLLAEIYNEIYKQKPEAIHVHGERELLYAVLARLRARHDFRLICSRHININRPKKDLWHRFLYRHVNAYLAVSSQIRDQAVRYVPIPAQRVHLLHHGAQLGASDPGARAVARSRLGIDDATFLVGAFSRIEYAKGQHTLIEATKLLYQSSVNMRLLIVGHTTEPAYGESLVKRVRDLEIDAQVGFLGFLPDARLLMNACDAVVVPSKHEGFSLVAIEAMAAGVPVLGTRGAGGVLNLIEHEKNGLLFDWNDAAMLAGQLRTLAQNAPLRAHLARNAYSLVERSFNFEDHLDVLEAHFFGRPAG